MFRPQGLSTLSTAFFLRARAGPVSCRQRSWDFAPLRSVLRWRVAARFRARRTHVPFSLPVIPRCSRNKAGPGRPRFLGSNPRERPLARRRTINPPPAGCSHGVLPLRAHQRMSCPGFRPVLLPRAFRCVAPENDASRRHLGVSIDTHLITTSLPDKPTLVATTLSGFCAACDQTCIQKLSRPGLLFRLAAFGCITAAVRRS